MKKFRLFMTVAFLGVMIACVALLAGCGKALMSPTSLTINSDTLQLYWSKVTSASTYTVSVKGEEYEREKTVKSN